MHTFAWLTFLLKILASCFSFHYLKHLYLLQRRVKFNLDHSVLVNISNCKPCHHNSWTHFLINPPHFVHFSSHIFIVIALWNTMPFSFHSPISLHSSLTGLTPTSLDSSFDYPSNPNFFFEEEFEWHILSIFTVLTLLQFNCETSYSAKCSAMWW